MVESAAGGTEQLLDPEAIQTALQTISDWLFAEVLVLSTVAQLVVVAATYGVAVLAAARVQTTLDRFAAEKPLWLRAHTALGVMRPLALPIVWLFLQWLAVLTAANAGWPNHLMKIVVSLLTAWVVIRLASQLVRDSVWSRLIAIVVWVIAALNIVDLLGPTIAILDAIAINFGSLRVSALTIIRALVALAVLLWGAIAVSRLVERRITALPNLTPSVQVLLAKITKILLVTIAIFAGLSSVGIDLTAFTVFSGALGVGIGFGLQKVVSNLFSGILLLLDKSVKPGDVIAIGDTYGWIKSLGARYTSVVTRDGTEHLIPNENLITNEVENWSYTDNYVRLRISIGVSYDADVRLAIQVCVEAAAEIERVAAERPPVCLLKGFSDSAVDLELRFWIADPRNGISNVQSQVLLAIWDKFHEHQIEIPYPQRDLHLKSVPAEFPAALGANKNTVAAE